MFAQDLVESKETFDILIEQDCRETSSFTGPLLDPDPANSMLVTKPAKKKRRSTKRTTNNPKFMPAIRIFRRDIRRKYAEMLNNVLNSYDLELHRRFLEEFGNPDLIQIIFQSYPADLFEKLSYAPRIEGIDSLVESIGRQYLTVPDIAFQLSDVKVCQRLNTPGSKVVATSMIRGTMLYSIVPTQRSIQDNDHELSSEKEDRSRYEDQVFLEMLDKQLDFCLEGIVTISLDDQHRFISISIEAEKVLS